MSLLLIFTIICASSIEVPLDHNNVKIYNTDDENWTCEDRGSYGIFCRSMHRPDTVTCEIYECTPVESKEWTMIHIHTCDTEFRCSLHTIAIPKSEPHPIAMLIVVFVILYFTLVIC